MDSFDPGLRANINFTQRGAASRLFGSVAEADQLRVSIADQKQKLLSLWELSQLGADEKPIEDEGVVS